LECVLWVASFMHKRINYCMRISYLRFVCALNNWADDSSVFVARCHGTSSIGWIGTRQIQTKRNISRVIPYFPCKRIPIDSPIRIFNTIRTSTISFHIVHNNSCQPYFNVIQIWVDFYVSLWVTWSRLYINKLRKKCV
jgi:hypothetical protein